MSASEYESRWFRLPETGDGSEQDPLRPAHVDREGVTRWGSNKARSSDAPFWIVKVRGDPAALDAIASEPGAVDFDNIPAEALNGMTGLTRTGEQWDTRW